MRRRAVVTQTSERRSNGASNVCLSVGARRKRGKSFGKASPHAASRQRKQLDAPVIVVHAEDTDGRRGDIPICGAFFNHRSRVHTEHSASTMPSRVSSRFPRLSTLMQPISVFPQSHAKRDKLVIARSEKEAF